jgi:riboflavin biosynthesis pyrimidine reductase
MPDSLEHLMEVYVREAEHASLSGFETLEDHLKEFDVFPVGNEWTSSLFDGPFFLSRSSDARMPAVSAVFVESKDGNTVTPRPEDLGGGATDFHLIFNGLSRVAADAVLAGANTVRESNYYIFSTWHQELVRLRKSLRKSRHPVQMIATKSGQFDMAQPLFNSPDLPVILLAPPDAANSLRSLATERRWIQVIDHVTWEETLSRLKRDFDIQTISLIGGRTLATTLVDSSLVIDLYLTTSPESGGKQNTPWYAGLKKIEKRLVIRKRGKGSDEGVIFSHYRLVS